MSATITGTGPAPGTFMVTDSSGVTAPATLDQLSLHPDLYAQAVSLSAPQAAVGGGPIDATAAGLASLGGKAYDAVDSVRQAIRDTNPDAHPAAPAAPQPTAPEPTTAVPPVPPPGPTPPPGGAPAGAALPQVAPRGTGGGAPRAPAGPDALTAGYQAQLEGEKAKEGAENKVYDQNEANRQAQAQAFAAKQAQLQASEEAAFKQQMDLQDQAAKAHNLDPNKWWSDKSTLGKVFFQIANLMNGAAVGAGGHPEQAGAFIDDQIKRNLEIQMKHAEGLEKSAEAKGNLVQHFRQAGLDNATAYQAAAATMKEQLATDLTRAAQKPGMEGISPALKLMAGKLQVDSVKEHTQLAKDRAETESSLGSAASSFASAAETRAKTAKLGQTTNADNIAKQLAAAGQPIPPQIRQYMSPELQKNLSGDGYLMTSEGNATESNKTTAQYKTHDATLGRLQSLLQSGKTDPETLSQAAQDALASAKDYYGLKRGGGEDDQGLTSMAPGLREALSADIKWATPAARERALKAVINQRNNIARRASGAQGAVGHPGVKGANIDFSKGLQ